MPVPEGWRLGQDWRYRVLAEYDFGPDYSSPSADVSGWDNGAGAFGGPPTLHPVFGRYPATVIPKDSTVWLRAQVSSAGSAVPIEIDGSLDVWSDGVLIYTSAGQPPGFNLTIDIPVGLLAVRFSDDPADPAGDWTWFDMPLPAGRPRVRQYPRDDGRGLSAAPRLFPPPRGDRLVGGMQ